MSTNIGKGKKIPAPGKAIRKVKKTRETMDDKGYFINEEYSSYEEYDLPKSTLPYKPPVKHEV
jgi:hypothetical protein